MKIAGYILFVFAFFSYGATISSIWRLVAETRNTKTSVNFNRFWWTPAWKVHRNAYPESSVRKQIVMRFITTFTLMIAAMACIAIAMVKFQI
jgi:ABC-type phosphate transport system permease subunit